MSAGYFEMSIFAGPLSYLRIRGSSGSSLSWARTTRIRPVRPIATSTAIARYRFMRTSSVGLEPPDDRRGNQMDGVRAVCVAAHQPSVGRRAGHAGERCRRHRWQRTTVEGRILEIEALEIVDKPEDRVRPEGVLAEERDRPRRRADLRHRFGNPLSRCSRARAGDHVDVGRREDDFSPRSDFEHVVDDVPRGAETDRVNAVA